ncbi:MAG: PaaX family transcriptional regulator [Arenicella sp.]
MAHSSQTVSEFLEHYCSDNKVRAKSLLSTFFGDLVVPHGGKVWVETLVSTLAPLGVSSRLIRTSLFRMAEEEWLSGTREGRKSFYQLTQRAQSQTDLAEKLLYYKDESEWSGEWTLVFILYETIDTDIRMQLEQELAWVGFGKAAKHVFAHPTASEKVVADRARSLGVSHGVVCMRATNCFDSSIGLDVTDQEMATLCFPTQDLEKKYTRFIEIFSGLNINSIESSANKPTIELLTLRLLLIDEYRRIILRDPHLPNELLPLNWVGGDAYALCKKIYQALLGQTDRLYLDLVTNAGPGLLKDLTHHYSQRFKG